MHFATPALLLAAAATALLASSSSGASRKVVSLSGPGWLCDGDEVSIPHTWNALDGADGSPDGAEPPKRGMSISADSYVRKVARYSRRLPEPTPGKRQFVRFDGVSRSARVYVNGRLAGTHDGAFTAFTVEATAFLNPSDNVLEVVVDNRWSEDVAPLSADYTLFGGIYRKVEWIETPPVCIDLVTDGACGVDLDVNVNGTVRARIRVLGGPDEERVFRVENPELWSPENPRLYEETFRIASGDEVKVRFGFRTAEFREDGFYLNGVRRKLRGVNRHQDAGLCGWAAKEADEERDFALIAELGADAVRLAHYPQSSRVYDICDEKGVLVWSELPATNWLRDTPGFRSNLLQQAREMIAQNRNHPSVFAWSLFNEIYNDVPEDEVNVGWMEEILCETRDAIRKMDPTRPVVAASDRPAMRRLNDIPDQLAFNAYPGWYGDTSMPEDISKWFAVTERRTLAIAEYGAGGNPFEHLDPLPETRIDPGGPIHPEEKQVQLHAADYTAIRAESRLWGAFVWAMFDFAADARREGGKNGVNDKGLVTRDRKVKKDAFFFYKANWSKDLVLHVCSQRMADTANESASVVGFSNCGDVTLSVNGKRIGTKSPDDVKVVEWRDVPLAVGENVIELSAGGLLSRRILTRRAAAKPVVIETEAFDSLGGWTIDSQFMETMGSPYLLAHGLGKPVSDATSEFSVARSCEYEVWAKTKNWTAWWSDVPAGRFQVLIDGVPLASEGGVSGDADWRWSKLGTVTLAEGQHVVALHDLTGFDGRCDKIALVQSGEWREGVFDSACASPRPTRRIAADVAVIGGGVAGICAAVTAARGGLRTVLVQDRPVLGGNNSSEVRVHLGGRQNLGPYPRLGDVVSEIGPAAGGNAKAASVYEDDRKLAVVRAERNIELLLNTKAMSVGKRGDAIASVGAVDVRTGEAVEIAADLFVDATGDGTIGFLAGADYRIGRESREETGEASAPAKADMMTMGSSIQWYAAAKGPSHFPREPWMIELSDENATAAMRGDWDWETGMGRDPIAEAERIRDYGMLVVYSNWAHVKNSPRTKDRFASSELAWVAFIAGRRESRRLLGDVVFSEKDVDGETSYPDATCLTSWSVDLHFPKLEKETKYAGEPFRAATVHKKVKSCPIPYRALYSRNVPNLFMAGRDISVTHAALGTVRVMRTTGMMGEVVGMAATICARHRCTPRDVYSNHLEELKAMMRKGAGLGRPQPPQNYNEGFTLGISEAATGVSSDGAR